MPKSPLDDIGVKLVAGAAVAFVTASAIIVPTGRQKDAAALEMFDKKFSELAPQDRRAAEFRAGHRRWTGFFEGSIYPITRKLPGSKNPAINP